METPPYMAWIEIKDNVTGATVRIQKDDFLTKDAADVWRSSVEGVLFGASFLFSQGGRHVSHD